MPTSAREYRERLYRLRSHPESRDDGEPWVDRRDSFLTVYFSLLPFMGIEYLVEVNWHSFPSGLIFPLGYLLFWAYYYTYYKPGFLEDHLSGPRKWHLASIPTLILGVAIWFVKFTLSELVRLFGLERLIIFRQREVPPREQSETRGSESQVFQIPSSQYSRSSSGANSLPSEIMEALRVLGLTEKASWAEIQHRYRELAKRYHPDLNPDITTAGRRFVMVDTAFRKIEAFRARDVYGRR